MEKKINGKQLIDEYIDKMENLYNEQKDLQQLYYDERLNDDYFNVNKSLKFTRTWEVIKDLAAPDRNLMLLFNACDGKYKDMLEALNGTGVQYKNESTLRVMVHNARKKIKEKYNERYGNS